MDSSPNPAFFANCPECDVESESDEFNEVRKFAEKHYEHTGHHMVWMNADFGYSPDMRIEWKLVCKPCNDVWRFEIPERAEEFKDEHAQYTDHEITSDPIMVTGDDPEVETVVSAIAELEERHEKGAPVQGVFALLTQNGSDISSIISELSEMRHKGSVYEPIEGHLRLT